MNDLESPNCPPNLTELEPGDSYKAAAPLCVHQSGVLLQQVRPNTSLNRTRNGKRRKAGAQRLRHCRAPALRRLPLRAG